MVELLTPDAIHDRAQFVIDAALAICADCHALKLTDSLVIAYLAARATICIAEEAKHTGSPTLLLAEAKLQQADKRFDESAAAAAPAVI